MTDKSAIGNRMKEYEAVESKRRFLPYLPIVARIDGKCFSKWTRGLKRPHDDNFRNLMVAVTIYLVKETGAKIGHTQSDEISLGFYEDNPKSQIFLDRRVQKMTSILASMATTKFNQLAPELLPEKSMHPALFDCRVWQLPTLEEAANVFVWRELDATKNSISMAAQTVYSHSDLHGKHGGEMQEMLHKKGINWNDYPASFKRGVFVRRSKVSRPFTAEEIDKLPQQHEARKDAELVVERHDVSIIDLPPLLKIINRQSVLFLGSDPMMFKEDSDAGLD